MDRHGTPLATPRGPSMRAVCALFAVLSTALACATPRRASAAPDRIASSTPRPAPVPEWVGEPLSWDKLSNIESWLRSDAAALSEFWRLEAQLQLSEGRLEFAERDMGSPIDPRHPRLRAARAAFEQVLESELATPDQRRRAQAGLGSGDGAPQPRGVAIAGIIDREHWGAERAIPAKMKHHPPRWRSITVHHSAMADPRPLSGSVQDSAGAVRDIQHAHMSAQSYGDIGYHFLIDPSGRVFEGRELVWQGAHAGGQNNVENIGICLIGNFENERPTRQALDSLERLVEELSERYSIDPHNVVPHSHWKNTACPGRYLESWLSQHS